MAARRNRRTTRAKPHETFRSYHSTICRTLSRSNETLQSLALDLFSEGIVDDQTKIVVMGADSSRFFSAANLLMDGVRLKLEQTPKMAKKVYETMHRQGYLCSIVEEMQKNESSTNLPQSSSSSATAGTASTSDGEEIETLSGESLIVC